MKFWLFVGVDAFPQLHDGLVVGRLAEDTGGEGTVHEQVLQQVLSKTTHTERLYFRHNGLFRCQAA